MLQLLIGLREGGEGAGWLGLLVTLGVLLVWVYTCGACYSSQLTGLYVMSVKLQQGCAQVHRTRLDCDQPEEEDRRPRGIRREGAHPRPCLHPPLAPSRAIRAAFQERGWPRANMLRCLGRWCPGSLKVLVAAVVVPGRGVKELVEERPGFHWIREDVMGVKEHGGRESSSSARAVAG